MPPVVTPPKDGPSTAGAGCPRCGQALIDPSGLGWCKACGYCRSLGAEQKPAAPPAPAKAAAPKPVVPGLAPAKKPFWAGEPPTSALIGVAALALPDARGKTTQFLVHAAAWARRC